MSYKFSPSTVGFYIDGLHTTIPSDAIAITDDAYNALCVDMSNGKVIMANPKTGEPMTVDFVPPAVTWDMVRVKRDGLLTSCDWTQTLDAPIDAATQTAWKTYRTTLRNLPSQYTDPSKVVWPVEPNGTAS